ncbi:MAG TPA: redoxin domain-containing protein [Syntrophales bacterium]|nr:redoxin domain-containing protein [Syntrophales bacterium]
MTERKVIAMGRKAKDFLLKDQDGEDFRLAAYRGNRILLSFHPLAWTPICAQQMKDLDRKHRSFQKFNTLAVGLSVDSVPCKAAWAKSLKLRHTRLLADFWPHGGVAKSLGILRPEGFSERANILLDETGKVVFTKVYPIRHVPDLNEILAALAAPAVTKRSAR